MQKFLLIGALALVAFSCAPRRGTGAGTEPGRCALDSAVAATESSTRPFPRPSVPEMLSDEAQAGRYLLMNWWDAFTDTSEVWGSDSLTLSGVSRQEVDRAFAEFAVLLGGADRQTGFEAVVRLFDRLAGMAPKDTLLFRDMAALTEKYLYNPNSPLRDEDLYLPFVERLAASRFAAPGMSLAYSYDAAMCRLNPVGGKAADFRYETAEGTISTLYGTQAPLLLLFFSNPGCPACREMRGTLLGDGLFQSMAAGGRLMVLNMYIDPDMEAWRAHLDDYPPEWISAFDPDQAIRAEVRYNVRAIPSVYLLDADKNVLLKDATTDKLLRTLHAMSGVDGEMGDK